MGFECQHCRCEPLQLPWLNPTSGNIFQRGRNQHGARAINVVCGEVSAVAVKASCQCTLGSLLVVCQLSLLSNVNLIHFCNQTESLQHSGTNHGIAVLYALSVIGLLCSIYLTHRLNRLALNLMKMQAR